MRAKSIIVAAVGLVTAASLVSADTTLHIDVNDVTASATGVTSGSTFTSQISSLLGYSGTITISIQGSSRLNDVAILGAGTLAGFFDLGSSGVEALKAITGTITVSGNSVTGVGFSVEAWDSTAMTTSTTYSASIFSGSGSLAIGLTGIIDIDGLTFAGMFTSSTYAGTDVSAFTAVQPLLGNFMNFQMNPGIGTSNETGIFTNSQLDVFITIPLPATSGLACAGLFGMGAIRRRR